MIYTKYSIYDSCLYEIKISGMECSTATIDSIRLLRVMPHSLLTLIILTGFDSLNIPADLIDNLMKL